MVEKVEVNSTRSSSSGSSNGGVGGSGSGGSSGSRVEGISITGAPKYIDVLKDLVSDTSLPTTTTTTASTATINTSGGGTSSGSGSGSDGGKMRSITSLHDMLNSYNTQVSML